MHSGHPTVSTERGISTWLQRLVLLAGLPTLLLVVAELTIRAIGVETDLAYVENAPIAVPVWLLADQAWVMERQADALIGVRNLLTVENLAAMYPFEEARWIQYRMKANVDTRVVNPWNNIEVEKKISFRLRSNSDGFRGEEIPPRKSGVTRIVTIGDSSTFGMGAEPEHMFQHILEAKLNEQIAGHYEIINLGISGQNTRHGLGTLRHYALPLEPDLLVISYGANDPRLVPIATDELLAGDDTWVGTVRFAMLKWRSYRLLRRLLFTYRNPLTVDPEVAAVVAPRVPAVSVDEYRENLIEIVQTARQAGVRTLLLSVCTRNKVYVANINNVSKWTNTPIVNAGTLFRESLDALADGTLHREKVKHYRSIYGRRALRSRRQWYVTSDGCHPNWVGHTLIADEMLPLVRKALDTPLQADPNSPKTLKK